MLAKLAAEFKVDLTNKVHDYLKENYPEDVLEWVKDAEWSLQNSVPLSEIKMARRPGGAREMDKVKGIAEAVKEGKPMDPVVLVKLSDGTYKIADGYHRTLGFKHAEKDSIRAYVAKVDTDNGPWDKEMHEKKLNIGKKASEAGYGLAKIANLFTGTKRFLGGLTGVSKKNAKRELGHARELSDLNMNHIYQGEMLKSNAGKAVKDSGGDVKSLAKPSVEHSKNTMDISMPISNRLNAAEAKMKQANRDTLLARGGTAVAATGGLAAYDYNQRMKKPPVDGTQPMLPKVANVNEEGLTSAQHTGLGIAGLGYGTGVLAANRKNLQVGETYYHGTSPENAASIRQQGLLASRAGEGVVSQMANLKENIGEENVKGKTYLTKNPEIASNYAARQTVGPNAFIIGESPGENVEFRIPKRHIDQGILKEIANPELKGLSVDDYVEKHWVDNFQNKMTYGDKEGFRNAVQQLDAPNVTTIEGDVPTRYIPGSKGYKRANLADLAYAVKDNPKRFATGAGIAGVGLGLAGLGADQIRRAAEK